MIGGSDAWSTLERPWHVCLSEAWASWRAGSAGIGAVVTGPGHTIISRGRNRILDPRTEPGVLANTMLAHAEMNALALVPMGPSDDRTVYTTFEPCLMCASTIIQQRIPRVRYAAPDPFFDGLHDWFATLACTGGRTPEREHLGGPVGAFAHVLHLTWLVFWLPPGDDVLAAHRRLAPGYVELASDVVASGRLLRVVDAGGEVADAFDELRPSLEALSG